MRKCFLLLLALLFCPVLQAQEKHKMVSYKPVVGDRFLTKVKGESHSKTLIEPNKVMEEVHKKMVQVFRSKILAVAKGEIQKEERFYLKCRRTGTKMVEGKKVKLDKIFSYEGKTIVISNVKGKYQFTYKNGKAIKDLDLLKSEFSKDDDEKDKFFFPKGGAVVGKNWKISEKKFKEEFDLEGFQFTKYKGVGILKKVLIRNKSTMGVISLHIQATITGVKGWSKAQGKTTLTMSGQGCLDGKADVGRGIFSMEMLLKGTVQGPNGPVSLKVENMGTMNLKKTPISR